VTDFLSRVAARAVGASAAAQPRLTGLFEPAGPAGDATLELVEEEAVAPAAAPRRDEAPPAGELDQGRPQPAAAPPAQLARGADRPNAPVEPRPPTPTDFVADSHYVPEPARASRARAREPERVPAARVEERVPVPVVAAAPLAHALPTAAAREPAPPPAPAAARVEEPPVRVHIGRLEVRANVQPPPPERPRREPAGPDGLSLADYLRGKREVRA
jgi:hypothetical protein